MVLETPTKIEKPIGIEEKGVARSGWNFILEIIHLITTFITPKGYQG